MYKITTNLSGNHNVNKEMINQNVLQNLVITEQ